MRKRKNKVQFWLSLREVNLLDERAKKCGLSRAAYVRHLVNGFMPRDVPPPDYFSMMRELYGIGRNLNQIAQKAHVLGVIDAQRYDEESKKLEEVISRLNALEKPQLPTSEDMYEQVNVLRG